MDINSIILEGLLVENPEVVTSPKGTPICRFSVATNRCYKSEGVDKKEVSFFDIEVWSKLAEICEKHLKKGRGVRIVGRLQQDRWLNSQNIGRSRVKIIGQHIEFKPQLKKKE